MIKFILLSMVVFPIALYPQTQDYCLTELRGMEDQKGNTHLFYWQKNLTGSDSVGKYENNIYHLDLSNGIDTLFLEQYGLVYRYYTEYSESIGDFEFWNNDPSKYIYTKTVCGFDCSASIIRFDGNPDDLQFGFVGIGKAAISKQNDSTLYSSYQYLLKSNDGGRNWFVANNSEKYLEFISLSPFNDSVIFAVNSNVQLVKSTDGGATFSFSDNLGFIEHNNLPFYFDKDSIHIYRLNPQQKIYTSNNKGEANTWTKKYSSTNNLYLSIDDSVSGTIFLADGNKIFKSIDYGNTFNLYKKLDSNIVGIYKKPASDILYAATNNDIYEITPSSLISIKHNTIVPEILSYYPLHVGDKWIYAGYYNDWKFYYYKNYIRSVAGKLTMPNNKTYYEVDEYYAPPYYTSMDIYYERVDSISGRVYRFNKDSVITGYEYLVDDLTLNTGDSVSNCNRFGDQDTITCVTFVGDTLLFNQSVTYKHYNSVRLISWFYNLAQNFGLISIESGDDNRMFDYSLQGAIINGKVYGDTTITGIAGSKEIPKKFYLYQNYPNPFNPSTTIKYQIPKPGLVQLKVYDILGREVAILVNEYQTAGMHSIQFSSDNKLQTTNHKQLSSGIYFYRLKAGGFAETKKLLLLK